MATFTHAELMQLWVDAGGAPAMADTMAAIAQAESSGCQYALAGPRDIRPVQQCVYRQTTQENSVGLWQINVQAHTRYSPADLWDPAANAAAAVAVLDHQAAPTDWSTYTNRAYTRYLTGARPPAPTPTGGDAGGGSSGGGATGPTGPLTGIAATAPLAWRGWRSLQASVNVALRASLRNAAIVNTATMRGIRR